MLNTVTRFLLPSLLCLTAATIMPAATISLDDVGTDPILTSPYFTFATDSVGNFAGQFTNQSNPPTNFYFLQLTAIFSPGFWNSAQGPQATGVFCDGKTAFTSCNINIQSSTYTIVFYFSGLDSNHHGVPYNNILGVAANGFEPFQTFAAQAATSPEPASFAMTALGLLVLVVGGKKFFKVRVGA